MTMNLQTCESSEIAAFSSASVAAAAAAAAVVEAPPPPPPSTATTMVVEGSIGSPSSRPGSPRGSGIRSVGSSSRPGSRRGSGVSLSSNGGRRRGSFQKRGSFLHLESTVADRTRHLLESLAHSSLQGSMEFLKDALPSSPSSFRRGDNNKKVDGGNKEVVKELEHGDVEVGKLVGKGGFSRVYELKAVRRRSFLNSLMDPEDDDDEHRSDDGSSASSEVIAKNFVVKHLNASVLCDEEDGAGGDRYRTAAADLAFEAKLLSSISHPNIVRLRGVTRGCEISALYAGGKLQQKRGPEGDGGFGGGYFIVLDKLECTLTERIVEWSKEKKALKKKSKSNKAVGNWARKRSSVILRRSSSVFGDPEGDDDDEQPSGWKVGRRSSAILCHRSSSVCDPEDEDEQQPSGWKANQRSSAFLRHRSSSVCDPEEEEQQPSAWRVTRRTSATLRHRASSIEDRASSMMGDDREDGNAKPTAVEHGSSQLKIQSPARPSRRGGRRSSLGARFRRRSTCSSFSSEASGGGGGNDDNDEKELVRSNHSTKSGGTAGTSSSRTLPSDHKDSERRCDDQKRDFLRRRLDVALQIARAVAYMHSRRILYRDLKPDNVGFDSVTGKVKIFDFGLARFLPRDGDEKKKLTGTAGTPRYMAPEVARCLRYGLEADAYSFGLLLWEILSLKRPFGKISPKELQEKVVYGTKRPKVDRLKWPETVCDLMETCWSSNPSERPGFGRILQVLDREVDTLAM